jgi:O-antigen ligase
MRLKTPFRRRGNTQARGSFSSFFQKVDFLPLVALMFPPSGMFRHNTLNGIAITFAVLLMIQQAYKRENPLKTWRLIPPPVLCGLGSLVLWMLLTSCWAVDPSISFLRALFVSSYIMLGSFLTSAALQSRQVEKTVRFFSYGFGIALCLLVFELYSHGWLYARVFGNPEYQWGVALMYSSQAVIPGIIMWPLVAHFLHKKRYGWMGAITVLSLAVFVQAGNEGARAAFLVGLCAFGATILFKERFLRLFRLGTLLSFAMMPLLIEEGSDMKRYVTMQVERAVYASHRFQIWEFCATSALQSPFKGYGMECLRVPKFFARAADSGAHAFYHVHNAALEIWIDLGIVGMLLILFLLDFLFLAIEKAALPILWKASFCASISAALVVTLTCFSCWHGWWLFLFCLMAPVVRALVLVNQRKTHEEHPSAPCMHVVRQKASSGAGFSRPPSDVLPAE